MKQDMNEKDALHSKNKVQYKENQGNLFQIKISKNIHSIILSYLSCRDIMRLKLVDQYNRSLVQYQYPDLIQRCQKQLEQLKEQEKAIGLGQLEQFIDYDSWGYEYEITEYKRYDTQLDKNLLYEFLCLKNPPKIIEDLKVVLYQLVHNTVIIDNHYRSWVRGFTLRGSLDYCFRQIRFWGVANLKEQVLNSMKNILTEANQAQIKSISLAAYHIFYYIKGVYQYSEIPQVKLKKEIKQVENNLKVLLKVKK